MGHVILLGELGFWELILASWIWTEGYGVIWNSLCYLDTDTRLSIEVFKLQLDLVDTFKP